MHICPACSGNLVQPMRWDQDGHTRNQWRVWLRCPDCEWQDEGVFSEDEVNAFDDHLDEGAEQLTETADELLRDGMAEAADTLARALAEDLITADDFRR